MIKTEKLCKTYMKADNTVRALDHVSLTVEPGQLVVVRGLSGSGKSTLLLSIGAMLRPDSGRVEIMGDDPYTMSADRRARFRSERIGFVFQQFHLVPYLSVRDNILAAALPAGLDPQEASRRTDELLERFHLADRATHLPRELSTGQCQRTALARAMLNQPKILLADEPTGNLDPKNGKIVLDAMSQFAKEGGSVLVVTHDPNADPYADRIVTITAGKLEE